MSVQSGIIAGADQTVLEFPLVGSSDRMNTVYVWGTWNGANFKVQSRPGLANGNGSFQWFDVEGAAFTADGTAIFIGRGGAFRVVTVGGDGGTSLRWEIA